MTVEVTMNNDDYNFIREYAENKNVSLPDFFLKSALAQIEEETLSDKDLLKISNELMEKNKNVYAELAK